MIILRTYHETVSLFTPSYFGNILTAIIVKSSPHVDSARVPDVTLGPISPLNKHPLLEPENIWRRVAVMPFVRAK